MKKFESQHTNEKGQALVLILLVLVIGATVAFAIAMRTIQDIRRSGQERSSNVAGDQVLSLIDAVSGRTIWPTIIDENGNFMVGSVCDPTTGPIFNVPGIIGGVCVLDDAAIEGLVSPFPDDMECEDDTKELQIRAENGINDLLIKKDSVYEVNLSNDSDNSLTLNWTSGSRLLFTYYSNSGPTATDPTGTWVIDSEEAYKLGGIAGWPAISVAVATDTNLNYPTVAGSEQYLRIRAIDSSAIITLKNIPTQQMGIRGSCYVGDTYREFVRVVPLYNFVPASFDYVLFDGTTIIDERSPN